jgi:hypothetical protein
MGPHDINGFFSIPKEDVAPLAERFFLRTAGFNLSEKKHRRMYDKALTVRSEIVNGICIEGFEAEYGPEVYDGSAVAVGDKRISATVFEQIPAKAVKRVILYVITAGECGGDRDGEIMAQLYTHMWGAAYVDAGRIILEGKIRERVLDEIKKEGILEPGLSPAFSPGFYGMDNGDSRTIVELLGANDIGVRCMDSGVMLPVKTCSGVFLATDGSVGFPGEECLVCVSNRSGCAQCMIANRRVLKV